MMKKDFWAWHSKKESIHFYKERPFFYPGEVWMCSLGANVGFEQDGAGPKFFRPIIILRKFTKEVFWGLPLTTRDKKGTYYYKIKPIKKGKPSTAILLQLRLVDAKRLQYRMGYVKRKDFVEIKKHLIALFQ